MNGQVIAVDGPGGSGKSTVSRALAKRLGWRHLDTGAFYRAATLIVLEEGADPTDGAAVLAAIDGRRFTQESGRMFIDGRDVSHEIRTDAVTSAVSAVSEHQRLRKHMVELQRHWVAEHPGAVVEGRDIGTVVFPSAALKVFLTADPSERARRRSAETGGDQTAVVKDLERRDSHDSKRTASPLKPAADAVTVDTTELGIDEVVDVIVSNLA